jgi:mRNA interferase MazF
MSDLPKRGKLVATPAMVRAVDRTSSVSAVAPKPPLEIRRSTRLGEVYWCAFSPHHYPPEFDDKHLVVVIRGAKPVFGAHVLVPLTKKPQVDNPHGYKLIRNPNPRSADQSWAVCDHIYTVASERLQRLRDSKGVMREPERIDAADFREISLRVLNALKPFLAQAHLPVTGPRDSGDGASADTPPARAKSASRADPT